MLKINRITKKIVLGIVFPVLVILILLGTYNYYNTISILNKYSVQSNEYLYDQIKSFVELQFVALDIIEEPIQNKMRKHSNDLINEFYGYSDTLKTINLKTVRRELGMDEQLCDVYIINKNGVVVNTTYAKDLGINFFDFGEVHKNYLLRIFNEGDFDSPKFFFEGTTKKYKKYSYQPTPDGKYIVEIGMYSEQADMVFDYMVDYLNDIDKKKSNISEVDLFFLLDNPTPLDPQKKFISNHLNIVPELVLGRVIEASQVNDDGDNINYTYLYVKNKSSKLIKGIIVRIVDDNSGEIAFKKSEQIKYFIGLILCFLAVSVIIFLINPIGKAIKSISDILKELAKGNLTIKIDDKIIKRKDELGELSSSIGTLTSSLIKTADFASQTGKGYFDTEYKLLSDEDTLGKALLTMQQSLAKAKQDELKTIEAEREEKYITDGLSNFGDLLRANNNNVSSLGYSIMQNLVNYLDVPMGALFLTVEDGDEKLLELHTAVAYDRNRNIKKRLKFAEELVGRCAFEKKQIYLKELPEDYYQVTSGLGDSLPRYLYLTPLISDDEVMGVIEIASFYDMEQYKRDFVDRLMKSLATTLLSVQMNQRNIELLDNSKRQARELGSKEEEMRQNIEELQATQEESLRREKELSHFATIIDASVFKVEYDIDGKILEINTRYSVFLDLDTDDLIGANFVDEYRRLKASSLKTSEMWKELKDGIPCSLRTDTYIRGDNIIIHEYYWPIQSNGIDVDRIIKVGYIGT